MSESSSEAVLQPAIEQLDPGLQEVFAPVAGFLGVTTGTAAGPDTARRLQLAQRLADLFDQYQMYPADWLDAWAAGRDVLHRAGTLGGDSPSTPTSDPVPADQLWQPALGGRCRRSRALTSAPARVLAFMNAFFRRYQIAARRCAGCPGVEKGKCGSYALRATCDHGRDWHGDSYHRRSATASTGAHIDDIGDLLRAANAGEPGALERLFAAAYDELRILARARLREGGRGTVLETTALVHESYLRLAQGDRLRSDGRRAFFAYASRVMRSTIVDEVRHRLAERRGGDLERVTLDTALGADFGPADDEPVRVHEALDVLGAAEPRLAQVVEMRYFGGYSEAEIADTLGLTARTVRRDWEKARLLLSTLLEPR